MEKESHLFNEKELAALNHFKALDCRRLCSSARGQLGADR